MKPRIRKWQGSLWECQGDGQVCIGYDIQDVYERWTKHCENINRLKSIHEKAVIEYHQG